jgi:Fe-S cluster assembly scaffold protein SufB
VAVDAIFDSVSIGTTYKEKLAEQGVIFCSISEAVEEHPDLVEKYLGSVVPVGDNYFAALNSAVFSDGSFVYIPKDTQCPMDLSTYFRINNGDSGQFERTLIVAEEGSSVTYLEGCTAPMYDSNQLHAAIVELVALDNAKSTIPRCRTGLRGMKTAKAASTTSSPSGASATRTPKSPGPRWKRARPSPGSTPVVCWWVTTPWASFTPWL